MIPPANAGRTTSSCRTPAAAAVTPAVSDGRPADIAAQLSDVPQGVSLLRIGGASAQDRQARKLALLIDIAKELSQQTEIDRLLDQVVGLTFQVMSVDRVAIHMAGPGGELTPRIWRSRADSSAGSWRVPRAIARKVVEELFVNTVVHGHGGDTDAPIRLALTVTPSAIAVRYEDTARAFDPFTVADEPDDEDDLDQRPIGGLGVRLIRAIVEDLHYARRESWNQLTFQIARSSGG